MDSESKTINVSDKIKEIIKESALSTTTHALPNIVRNKNMFIKLMWVFCFIVSNGICALVVSKSILNYLTYEVVTVFNLVYENPTQFPTVTFCNQDPIHSLELDDFINKTFTELWSTPSFKGRVDLTKTAVMYGLVSILRNDSMKRKSGLSIDDMLISCKFDLNVCNASMFEWHYDLFYGNCYKFNSNGNMIVTRTGKFGALNLELFIGSKSLNNLAMEKGVHVFINNKTIGINANEGYDVPVGQNSNIALRKVLINKLEYPYSDCVETGIKSPYYDRIKKANQFYRQKDCFELLCFPEYLYSKCACYDPRAVNYYPNDLCSTSEEFVCMLAAYFNFSNTDFQASCNCPLECSSVKYDLIMSSLTYPSENYAELLLKNPTVTNRFKEPVDFDLLKKSILSLNIYLDDLQYTEINQVKKIELVDLISGIGGTLGLFLGVSFLSFIEIIEVMVHIFCTVCSKMTKVSTKSQQA